MASHANHPATRQPADTPVTESPDWPTIFHPRGVIRLVSLAEEQCLRGKLRTPGREESGQRILD
jgi:hypothetical protein